MLFEKIIEISQSKDLGKTSFIRKGTTELPNDSSEPTLHYFFRKKQAEKIAEENESLAKRIIHQ